MNYTMKIASIVTPIAIAWFMFYLLGAFISASWSLPEWTQEARFLAAAWGSVFGGAIWYRLECRHD